jgi:hypothetical protein
MTRGAQLTASVVVFIVIGLAAAVLLGCGGQATGSGPGGGSAQASPGPLPTAVVANPGDPKAQQFVVDPSDGYWDPEVVRAKAGKPIEITFEKGTYECANGFTFAAFGVNTAVDLSHGPVTIRSAGLPAGTYKWLCSMQGMCGGKLVVH